MSKVKKTMRARYVVVLGAFLLVTTAFLTWPRESLAITGKRAMTCLERGNAQCIYDLTPEWERQAYGLTSAKAKSLLERYGKTFLENPVRSSLKLEGDPETGSIVASKQFHMAAGGQTGFGAVIVKTDEGYQAMSLFASLFIQIAQEKYMRRTSTDRHRKAKAWIEFCRREGPELEKIGFMGIYRGVNDGFYTWGQFEEYCRQQIERSENRQQATNHG